jgi:DNA ligase 1
VHLAEIVATSAALTETRSRRRKIEALAACLGRLTPDETAIGVAFLAGEPRQARLEVGYRTLATVDPEPAAAASLTLADVDAALATLAGEGGPGSRGRRLAILEDLLGRATADEQRFVRGLIVGELRQGALAGLMAQAIAAAFGVEERAVRRAVMLQADLGAVAAAARDGGAEALASFRLQLFRPVQPMLAQTAATLDDAVAGLEQPVVETKLDGARVQVHRDGDEVRCYTRGLRDVTGQLSRVADVVAALPARRLVLDGEVLAVRADGRPEAFQESMRQLGTERAITEVAAARTLTPFFFDCLHRDGRDLLDEPLAERRRVLVDVVPAAHRTEGTVAGDRDAAQQVVADALAAGHEGVMVKDATAAYEAGRRGAAWRKLKPVHTLDLVVLGVEWGSGRRRGWLSNLHLGARDDATGDVVMLGKTFKGLTDELLEWQTRELLAREIGRDGHIVWVRPELVVEIAIDGVVRSPRYPAGMALRFARVRRYREDKTADEADTVDTVRAIHEGRLLPA